MDGHIYAKALPCDGYPHLYVLNGLGGGGIARGPGGGSHVAKLVSAALGYGSGPTELPESDLSQTLTRLALELTGYVLAFFFGLLFISLTFFCVHWCGPKRCTVRKTHRCEACCLILLFVLLTTCLAILVVMTTIAVEAAYLLAAGAAVYLLCGVGFVVWKWCRRSRRKNKVAVTSA
jgi:hypothetical protein